MTGTTIRVGGYGPPDTPHSRALDHFAATMRDLVGEAAEVEILYNVMDLNRPITDLFSMVREGELTWCYFSTSYLGHPLADAIEIPFLFDTLREAHRALDGPFGQAVADGIRADRGFEILGFWDNGFRHLTNTIRPIATPDDCAGLTIRVQPNPVHIALCEAWGMHPVGVGLDRGIEMISAGEVDAQENPLANTHAYGVDHQYITMTAHLYGARGLFADAAAMEAMPAELAAAVRTAARAAVEFQRSAAADYELELQERFAAEGRHIVIPAPAQRAMFRDAAAAVIDTAVATVDKDVLALLETTTPEGGITMAKLIEFATAPRVERGDGITSVQLTDPPLDGQNFVMGITSFPPGGELPLHSHNTVEQVTVLAGTGIAELNGEQHRAVPFDTTHIPAGEFHRFINDGDTDMTILWVYGDTQPTRTWAATGETVDQFVRPT